MGGRAMNDWESERIQAAGEAEHRIGLYRDTLTDRNAALKEALSGLIDATANVIDVGPAYDQAVRVLKAAQAATG